MEVLATCERNKNGDIEISTSSFEVPEGTFFGLYLQRDVFGISSYARQYGDPKITNNGLKTVISNPYTRTRCRRMRYQWAPFGGIWVLEYNSGKAVKQVFINDAYRNLKTAVDNAWDHYPEKDRYQIDKYGNAYIAGVHVGKYEEYK